ncbi:phosphonate ABC transporter, permease protein PhnE [Kaistia defluvii]|uniref:Phosphonate transport system permease protein n=1 Tax=Kaistia defluvii TaxID=410841 RepID=A0ABV2QW18_9HYPH
MATAIAKLPDQQAAALSRAYASSVAAKRMKTLGVLAVLAVLIVISGQMADIRPWKLITNIGNFGSFIGRTLPTLTIGNFFADMASWYWNFGAWFRLLVETILIAYLGTFLGGILAFCLCFFASANLVRNKTTRFVARRFLEFCRTVPDIVFALIFVIAFGLGPMAGVLALTIHTVGALGKLFAEVVENIDMKPVEGLQATGASWLQVVRFGVLPQVSSGFASYALLRFEINVRGAGVMGFVGAGGIGQEFLIAIRNFYYTDVSAILLMIIVTVILIDLGTEQVRHRLIGMERMR